MKTLHIILIILFLPVQVVFAQFLSNEELKSSFYKHMEGTLVSGNNATDSLPVSLNLRKKDNSISGTAYYKDDVVFLTLDGFVNERGILKFEALNREYEIKGNFKGAFYDTSTFKGTMERTKKGKKEEWRFTLQEDYSNSIAFKNFQFTDTYYINNNKNYPYVRINIDFLYPVNHSDEAVLEKIQYQAEEQFFGDYALRNNPQKNIKRKRDNVFSDYKNIIESNYQHDPDKIRYYIWESTYSSEIIYNSDEILIIKVVSEEDVGGQAQSGGQNYLVIDRKTGKEITLDKIFREGFRKPLSTIITDQIKVDYELNSNTELIESGFLADMIRPNDNYYVNQQGIGFYYEPYEINEFEARVFLPYKNIEMILKEDSPISQFYPDNLNFGGDYKFLAKAHEQLLELYSSLKKSSMPDPDAMDTEYVQSDSSSGDVQYPDEDSSSEGGQVVYPGKNSSEQDTSQGKVMYPDEND